MSQVPTVIGRYEIRERIGQGGMGALYLSWDPMLERQVAIKLLREADNDDLRARFTREARSVARLRHPNIVTIFDVGEHEGQPFIAMEYIQGATLGQVIKSGTPLSVVRKLEIVAELCAGLHYAHKAGIVHRDVKPANLMLDSDNVLKVLDFGIARLAESGMTQAGLLIGTLNYMSPEQVTGRQVDARSDIFAVGSVFYELLTRRQAFPGRLEDGILNRILNEHPPPVDQLQPTIDAEVTRIVDRALAKKCEDRYVDLAAMRKDLLRAHAQLEMASDPALSSEQTIVISSPTSTPVRALRATPEDLQRRRLQQIDDHVSAAERSYDGGSFETALNSVEQALMLDPQHVRALELADRARHALDRHQVHQWLDDAQEQLRRGALSSAQQLVEQAIALVPDSAPALELQRAVEARRVERERERQRAEQRQAAIVRGAAALAAGQLADALQAADEAVGLDPHDPSARALRADVQRRVEEQQRRAREDAERQAREEAERRAREAAALKAKQDADRRAREDAERRAREAAERRVREEAERKAREAAALKAKEEAEQRAREEATRKAREDAERKVREAVALKAKQDAEKRAREAAEQRARDEMERKAREAAALKAKQDEEQRAREEAKRKARADAERQAREAAALHAKQEADQRAREEGERRAREEAERKAREAAALKAKQDAERQAREGAERKARDAAERKAWEDAERTAREDAERSARRLQQQADNDRRAKDAAAAAATAQSSRQERDTADRTLLMPPPAAAPAVPATPALPAALVPPLPAVRASTAHAAPDPTAAVAPSALHTPAGARVGVTFTPLHYAAAAVLAVILVGVGYFALSGDAPTPVARDTAPSPSSTAAPTSSPSSTAAATPTASGPAASPASEPAPAVVPPPAATSAPAPPTAPVSAAPGVTPASPPPATAEAARLTGLQQRAQTLAQRGQTLEAATTLAAALKIEGDHATTRSLLARLLTESNARMTQARTASLQAGASDASSPAFTQARARETEGRRLQKIGNEPDAVRALLSATDLYVRATADAKRAAAAPPAAPPVAVPVAPVEVTPPPVAPPPPPPERPSPTETRAADESAIRTVLRGYESAYRNLDAGAVQRIYPGIDMKGVSRAFQEMRAQDVSIQNEQIVIDGATARVTASVKQSFTPRAGRGREASYRAEFMLRKSGSSWVISGLIRR